MSLDLKKKTNSKTGRYSFVNHLKQKFDKAGSNGPNASVGALLRGTVNSLVNKRYSELRVEQITKSSNISRATFYNHFDSKLAICCDVFIEYSIFTNDLIFTTEKTNYLFDQMFEICLNYIKLLQANSALHHRFIELSSEMPEISNLLYEYTRRNIESFSNQLNQNKEDLFVRDQLADRWLTTSLLHENAYGIYVTGRTPARRISIKSPEHLAYKVSLMMYRAEFACDPPDTCDAHQFR